MGTGMGMRSYSMMEQGKVDQVLSSRPEDRRSIFEEASGITKYKSKKEEALRRLERTGENLQRIGDIIVEVKRQIKSMERQVNKARRYKQEFETLKEYELKASQHEYQGLKKKKKDLENNINQGQKEESFLNAKMNSLTENLEKVKGDLSSVEERISSIQEENYEIFTAIKTTDNKISLDKERIEELSRREEGLDGQIQELEKKLAATSEQIKDAQRQIEAIEQKKQESSDLLVEKEEGVDNILTSVKETQKKISGDKAQEMEIIAHQTQLKNDLGKLQAELATFNARLRRLNVEHERTEQDLENIGEKERICAEELVSVSEQSKHLTREIWDLKSNLNIKLEKKQSLDNCLQEIVQQETVLQSKLDFLKEISKKYEGFSKGVKSILSARDSRVLEIEDLYGVVANLIEVSPQYQIAIEMALGSDAQAIVVENRQVACAAINYLKEKDAGRANFICLDSVKATNERRFRPKSDVLGAALEFIKVSPEYQRLLEYLLANTFIIQDTQTAQRILEKADPCVKLVTLNGEILTSVSISGGASAGDRQLNLLGRQERIAQGLAKLEELKREKDNLESLKSGQETEVKEITELIQQKEPDLNKLKIRVANKESEKTNIETEKKRFEDEIAVLKVEIDETKEQLEQLNADQERLNQQLRELEQEQKELQRRTQSSHSFITEKDQERQNLLVEIAQTKTQLSALDREAQDAQVRLKMLLDSQAEQTSSKEAKEQEAQDATAKIEQLRQEITKLELQAKDLSQRRVKMETRMNETAGERKKLSATIQNLEAMARETQKQLNETRDKKANLQIRLTELNYKQDSLKDRMLQSYQVDLQATLEDTLEVSPPEPFVFDEIKRLKSKLEGMGPINLVAIEENDQLQQRYSFLVAQQEDLSNAQDSLRKAITQINRTARTMFSETFQKVQVSFKEYFRILFGGGDARLILLDENNVLESGIEIVVRPPGKSLQNISLLSGGEKALTAIALLFAVFKVKPSPFCILDEVDAALDESNVNRFTNLLFEFIKTSQFIIVTHNKKTINMADIMYGITMEKSGVSKIVSVRFTEGREASARGEVVQVGK